MCPKRRGTIDVFKLNRIEGNHYDRFTGTEQHAFFEVVINPAAQSPISEFLCRANGIVYFNKLQVVLAKIGIDV